MTIVKVIVMTRTKKGKPCLSKGLREFRSPLLGQGRPYTCAERLLVGQKLGNNTRP